MYPQGQCGAGDLITYTLTLGNTGRRRCNQSWWCATACHPKRAYILGSATGAPVTVSGGDLTWTVASLPVGASAVLSFRWVWTALGLLGAVPLTWPIRPGSSVTRGHSAAGRGPTRSAIRPLVTPPQGCSAGAWQWRGNLLWQPADIRAHIHQHRLAAADRRADHRQCSVREHPSWTRLMLGSRPSRPTGRGQVTWVPGYAGRGADWHGDVPRERGPSDDSSRPEHRQHLARWRSTSWWSLSCPTRPRIRPGPCPDRHAGGPGVCRQQWQRHFKTPREPGIGGVTIALMELTTMAQRCLVTAITASDGTFTFTHLLPGTYTHVTETPPSNYLDGAIRQAPWAGELGPHTLSGHRRALDGAGTGPTTSATTMPASSEPRPAPTAVLDHFAGNGFWWGGAVVVRPHSRADADADPDTSTSCGDTRADPGRSCPSQRRYGVPQLTIAVVPSDPLIVGQNVDLLVTITLVHRRNRAAYGDCSARQPPAVRIRSGRLNCIE